MGASNYVYAECELVKAATDKAVLCVIDGEEHWLPRSQIADGDDYEKGDGPCTLGITEYIAREKGIEASEA